MAASKLASVFSGKAADAWDTCVRATSRAVPGDKHKTTIPRGGPSTLQDELACCELA
jgi:hypothetical protein